MFEDDDDEFFLPPPPVALATFVEATKENLTEDAMVRDKRYPEKVYKFAWFVYYGLDSVVEAWSLDGVYRKSIWLNNCEVLAEPVPVK